jgi:selenocysteine lyase/cysteine desulfurase
LNLGEVSSINFHPASGQARGRSCNVRHRIRFAHYNTKEETLRLIDALESILGSYKAGRSGCCVKH